MWNVMVLKPIFGKLESDYGRLTCRQVLCVLNTRSNKYLVLMYFKSYSVYLRWDDWVSEEKHIDIQTHDKAARGSCSIMGIPEQHNRCIGERQATYDIGGKGRSGHKRKHYRLYWGSGKQKELVSIARSGCLSVAANTKVGAPWGSMLWSRLYFVHGRLLVS